MEMETQEQEIASSKTQELGNKLFERAVKRLNTAEKVLNEEFSYKIAVKKGDSLSLNDAEVNGEGRTTNNIQVVVSSKVAKAQLKELSGLDFDEIQRELRDNENQRASAVAELSLASTFKRVSKDLIQ